MSITALHESGQSFSRRRIDSDELYSMEIQWIGARVMSSVRLIF
jgi:hypothetical protein